MRPKLKATIATLTCVAAATAGVTQVAAIQARDEPQEAPEPAAQTAARPNFIYIQTDDMSADLLQYMTEVQAMQEQGTTLDNFFYGDSLCCSSRATILSGKFPHNTGVLTNTSEFGDGGLGAFLDDEGRTIGTELRQAGYRTGLMGKYLNEYRPQGAKPEWSYDYPEQYVPPGWDEWHVAGGGGYGEMTYAMTRKIDDNKKQENFEDQYLTDVLSDKASNFLDRAVSDHPDQPFFLEVATFAPHSKTQPDPELPFVPAPRDRANPETGFTGDCGPADCADVKAPRTDPFDDAIANAPEWLRDTAMTSDEIAAIDHKYVLRVQMMQAVNDMIKALRAKLVDLGVADNTYLVFGSDNGFHLGEHRLLNGKGTPYDHDARVPLIVVGPEVLAGQTRTQLVQNVDLYATFLRAANVEPGKQNGNSMLPLWQGETMWARDAAYIEHTSHGAASEGDPDATADPANAQPGTYKAIRTETELYVEYKTGEVEYYDLTSDPNQLSNVIADLPDERRTLLHNTVSALSTCGQPDKPSCWSASSIDGQEERG